MNNQTLQAALATAAEINQAVDNDCYVQACVANLLRAAQSLLQHNDSGSLLHLADATCYVHCYHNNAVKYVDGMQPYADQLQAKAMLDAYYLQRYCHQGNKVGEAEATYKLG